MSENKKVRFTFIDGIIVLVIIAVIAFVGYNFFGKEVVQNQATSDTFEISFYIEEAPDFAAESIEVGSGVTDEAKKVPLGTIKNLEVADSVSFGGTSEGKIVKTTKEGYKSIKITAEVSGNEFEHGIKVAGNEYVVGHSMTIYAGKAKLYGRISGLQKK